MDYKSEKYQEFLRKEVFGREEFLKRLYFWNGPDSIKDYLAC